MVVKPCLRCGRLTPAGSYCAAHQPAPKRKISARPWNRTRDTVLQRDRHRCHYCGAPATEVDHVLPVARGGTDAQDNLVAACRNCNLAKGAD